MTESSPHRPQPLGYAWSARSFSCNETKRCGRLAQEKATRYAMALARLDVGRKAPPTTKQWSHSPLKRHHRASLFLPPRKLRAGRRTILPAGHKPRQNFYFYVKFMHNSTVWLKHKLNVFKLFCSPPARGAKSRIAAPDCPTGCVQPVPPN